VAPGTWNLKVKPENAADADLDDVVLAVHYLAQR
jgi:hypothetical protein